MTHSIVLPKAMLAATTVRTLQGFSASLCSATGSPPVYTALIRNYTVLVNSTGTATVQLHEEGNYTCVATSKYGTDVREFVVVFNGEDFGQAPLTLYLSDPLWSSS